MSLVCLVELPDAKLCDGQTEVFVLSGCLLAIVDFAVIGHFILILYDFGKLGGFSVGLLVHHPVPDLNDGLPVAVVQRVLVLQLSRERIAEDSGFVRTHTGLPLGGQFGLQTRPGDVEQVLLFREADADVLSVVYELCVRQEYLLPRSRTPRPPSPASPPAPPSSTAAAPFKSIYQNSMYHPSMPSSTHLPFTSCSVQSLLGGEEFVDAYVLRAQVVEGGEQHFYLCVFGLADVENDLLQFLLLALESLRLLNLLLQLQVLPLQLAVGAAQLLNLLLQVVEFVGVEGVGGGKKGRGEGGGVIGLESALDLVFELFEAHLLFLELHFHVEFGLLHVVVLLAGLLQLLSQLPDNRILLLQGTREFALLAVLLSDPVAVALGVSELLAEMFDGFLVLLEVEEFVLEKDVLLTTAGELLLVFAHGLQQLHLQVVVHGPQLLHLRSPHRLRPLLPVLLLHLLQHLPRLQQLPLVLLPRRTHLLHLFPQQLVLAGQFLQLFGQSVVEGVAGGVDEAFSDGVLYDFYECLLTAFVEVHDGLDVVLLVGRLHEDGDDQFEEAEDVGGGLVLGDLDEFDVAGEQRLPPLPHVPLHPLHDYLQVRQLLYPPLARRLQILQPQREVLHRRQQVREHHPARKLPQTAHRTHVVGREGAGETDEGVLDVLIVRHQIIIICHPSSNHAAAPHNSGPVCQPRGGPPLLLLGH